MLSRVSARRLLAGEPLVVVLHAGHLGRDASRDDGNPEGVVPLILVVRPGERRRIDERRSSDDPFGEVILRRRLPSELPRCYGVAGEDHGGHAGGLHPGDRLQRGLLDRRWIERVLDHFGERCAGVAHRGGEAIGELGLAGAGVDVDEAELALGVDEVVTGVRSRLVDELLLDELEDVILLLLRSCVDPPDEGVVLLVERIWLTRRAAHAQHAASGELVAECRGERRTAPHHERFDLLGDAYRVGAGRHLVGSRFPLASKPITSTWRPYISW